MSNLLQRILTAVVAVPLLLALIYLAPSWVWTLFVTVIAIISAREFYGIVTRESRRLAWIGPAFSAAIVATLGFFPHDIRVWITSTSLLAFIALLSFLFHPGDIKQIPTRAGSLALGLLYTGVLPALVALLHQIPDHGPDLIVLLLMVAFLGDTGAYTAGRLFGRHPLYPAVSPKKTWEGSVGGLISSAGASVIAHYWFLPELPLVPGIILGAALGALGQVGDLCESLLKRACDIKDSGNLLPGHGGMLDRIDGVLFVTAGLYLSLLWYPLLLQ